MRQGRILVLLAFVAAPAAAQHSQEAHGSATKPVELLSDLGQHQHRITTGSDEAQKFFDHGLTLLYGFNHDEAARYFRRASELDAGAAMPYWGIAFSTGPNYNDTAVDEARARATYDAVQQALARASKASPREQAYIRALARRYPSPDPGSDWKAHHLAYSEAMRELVREYPDDLDAATLFAESLMMLRPWQLWTLDGQPAPGTLELVAVLEGVLKRDPMHPGANHFYIHAVEASPNLERAIPSAMRLMDLVPGAGHLVHMPGHIFLQTGDYELAAQTNVNAAEADRKFVERTGATGMYPAMYWTHNIHFIAYARMQQGRYEPAKQAAAAMVRNAASGVAEMQMLEGFLTYPLSVELRFHAWDAILDSPSPDPDRKLATAFWHYARAMAYAGQGKRRPATREQKKFSAARKAVPEEHRYLINNSAADFLAVAGATLDAQLAVLRKDGPGSIQRLREAADLQAKLEYDEPPPWFYPIAQSLGAALLRGGQATEAEAVFRRALERHPRDGRLLFGLWQSLLAQERTPDAHLVERQFQAAWKDATGPLHLDAL
jgi:tetratricopeptide (TPR) repeat protein